MDQDLYTRYAIEIDDKQVKIVYNAQKSEVAVNGKITATISQEKLEDMISTLKVIGINARRV